MLVRYTTIPSYIRAPTPVDHVCACRLQHLPYANGSRIVNPVPRTSIAGTEWLGIGLTCAAVYGATLMPQNAMTPMRAMPWMTMFARPARFVLPLSLQRRWHACDGVKVVQQEAMAELEPEPGHVPRLAGLWLCQHIDLMCNFLMSPNYYFLFQIKLLLKIPKFPTIQKNDKIILIHGFSSILKLNIFQGTHYKQ